VPKTADITIDGGSHIFALHKFLLSARTPYFRKKLEAAPETQILRLPSSIPAHSFRLVLRYLYLGEFPRDVADPEGLSSDEDILTGVDKISKHLEIEHVWDTIMSINDRRLTRQRHQDEVNRAQQQVEDLFLSAVVGKRMVVDESSIDQIKWGRDNSIFADCILAAKEPELDVDGVEIQEHPTLMRSSSIPIGPSSSEEPALLNGTEFASRRKVVLYPAHRAVLLRSPVWEKMFSGHFKEAQRSQYLPVINVECHPDVLELILKFLYTEKSDPCPLDLALDLLYAADMLFLDKLKAKAATVISTLGSATANQLVDRTRVVVGPDGSPIEVTETVEVEPINVYDVIETAWLLGIQRLEEFAARYLAYRLEDYIDEDEFRDVIKRSAARVKDRQETDTIELLDDIRYYLSERFRLRFEDVGLEDIMDDNGEIGESRAEELAEAAAARVGGTEGVEGQQGVFRTLDGEVVEDEFDSDAINHQILLSKIDKMLEDLKLDA
jgi:ankyrin repeat and BTB/POZ domain-containing protein 1